MGNQLCIEASPRGVQPTHAFEKARDSNVLRIWRFVAESEEAFPISLSSLHTFSDNECYVILHATNATQPDTATSEALPTQQERSLLHLVKSTIENLTPRGLEKMFSTVDETYTIYLWNGKNAAPQMRQTASKYAVRLQALVKEDPSNLLCAAVIPFSAIFKNDIPSPRESPRYEHQQLFRNSLLQHYLAHSTKLREPVEQRPAPASFNLSIPVTAFKMSLEPTPVGRKDPEVEQNDEESDSEEDEEMENDNSGESSENEDSDEYSEEDEEETDSDSEDEQRPQPMQEDPKPKGLTLGLPSLKLGRMAVAASLAMSPMSPRSTSARSHDRSRFIEALSNSVSRSGSGSTSSRERGTFESKSGSNSISSSQGEGRISGLSSSLLSPDISSEKLVYELKDVCSKIEDGLFLGSAHVAKNKGTLLDNGIRYVINTAKVVLKNFFESEKQFHYLGLELLDDKGLSIIGIFYEAIEFIQKAQSRGGSVFIHCEKGVSRSSTVTIAFHMYKHKMAYNDSLMYVKSRRACVSPNPGFLVQLMTWEKMLLQPPVPRLFRIAPVSKDFHQIIPKMCNSSSTDSRTAFVLAGDDGIIRVWKGRLSSSMLNDKALLLAQRMQRLHDCYSSIIQVDEGEEDDSFKDQLSRTKGFLPVSDSPYLDLDHIPDHDVPSQPSPIDQLDEESESEASESEEEDESQHHPGVLYELEDGKWDELTSFFTEDLFPNRSYVLVPGDDSSFHKTLFVWVGPEVDIGDVSLEEYANSVVSSFVEYKPVEYAGVVAVLGKDEDEEDYEHDFFLFFQDVE